MELLILQIYYVKMNKNLEQILGNFEKCKISNQQKFINNEIEVEDNNFLELTDALCNLEHNREELEKTMASKFLKRDADFSKFEYLSRVFSEDINAPHISEESFMDCSNHTKFVNHPFIHKDQTHDTYSEGNSNNTLNMEKKSYIIYSSNSDKLEIAADEIFDNINFISLKGSDYIEHNMYTASNNRLKQIKNHFYT